MERKTFRERLYKEKEAGNHIIGVAAGTGLTAKNAILGGADFILVLNSGILRQMGIGSYGGYLAFANANDMVAQCGLREFIPKFEDFPLFFGLHATDPTRDMKTYLKKIQDWGFTGINNYPSIGLFDGQFREALEETGISYDREVEVMAMASDLGLATVAFVFNEYQAKQMIEAGADIICAHLGFTQGGILGAAKVVSLTDGQKRVQAVFDVCKKMDRQMIKTLYGGPVKTPTDVQYMYQNTDADGYIGGSVFDRIPTERSVIEITKTFKATETMEEGDIAEKMVEDIVKYYDYVGFVKDYVREHYMEHISFTTLSEMCRLSRSHLSALFTKEVGCSFKEYLVHYRIKKAAKLLSEQTLRICDAARMTGYDDAAQFSRMFKKTLGVAPREYQKRHQHK